MTDASILKTTFGMSLDIFSNPLDGVVQQMSTYFFITAIALTTALYLGHYLYQQGYRRGSRESRNLLNHLKEANKLASDYYAFATEVREQFNLQFPEGSKFFWTPRSEKLKGATANHLKMVATKSKVKNIDDKK